MFSSIKVMMCLVLCVGPYCAEASAEGLFPRIRANINARQQARQNARNAYNASLNGSYRSYGSSGSSGYSYGSSGSTGYVSYGCSCENCTCENCECATMIIEETVSNGSSDGHGSTGGYNGYEVTKPGYQFAPLKKARCFINAAGNRVCPLGAIKTIDISTTVAPISKIEIAIVDIKAPIDNVNNTIALN